MSASHRSAPSLVLALLVALVGSLECHHGEDIGADGRLVGGACGHDADCDYRCVEGNDFPDGMCTVDCNNDSDCPGGTTCVDPAGGVCLLPCTPEDDCRHGYDCRDTKRQGAGGHAPVCIGN